MKSLKKVLVTIVLSSTLFIGGIVPITAFAYSESVEKKLEKIDKDIEKQEEKLNKISSRSNGTSGSKNTRGDKIRERINDLRKEATDIQQKDNKRVAKDVKAIELKKTQSKNKIKALEKDKFEKGKAAKQKYDNDVKARMLVDPQYNPPVFKYSSGSVDGQIKSERQKIDRLDDEIAKLRGLSPQKNKKNK